jgi:hypothetical protein
VTHGAQDCQQIGAEDVVSGVGASRLISPAAFKSRQRVSGIGAFSKARFWTT